MDALYASIDEHRNSIDHINAVVEHQLTTKRHSVLRLINLNSVNHFSRCLHCLLLELPIRQSIKRVREISQGPL